MNDDPIAPQVSSVSSQVPAQPAPAALPQAESAVDDVVAQATAIQDLFKQNDATVLQQPTPPVVSDQPSPAPVVQTAPQPSAAAEPPQKSPLDILEEILSKEDKKNAAPPEEKGPTPEELELIKQQEAQNQALIEEARQKMFAESASEEQRKRDAIRHQQMDANTVNNPFEIRQLGHKKITT